MKRQFLILITLLLAVSGSAQTENTRLWRISGKGLTQNSYLYGSMHVDDARAFNFSDSVFYALSRCELFANEVSFDSVIDFVYKSMDQSFRQIVQKEYFSDDDEALEEISQSTGLGTRSLKRMSPVVLRQLMPGISGPRKRMPAMLDSYLYNIARKEGKRCIGIEAISRQINLFNQYPDALRSDYTRYTIGKDRVITNKKLLDIYRKADLRETWKVMSVLPDDLYKALLTDRNLDMVNVMDTLSAAHSVFYTIGFAHLPGKDGLIELLRAKGFTVEPVPETFTGKAASFPFKTDPIPWVPYVDSVSGFSVNFPGRSYTSPDIPSGMAHRLFMDIGTNCFYMVFSRSTAGLGTIRDMDSLLRAFSETAWKIRPSDIRTSPVELPGLRVAQANKIPYGAYYLSVRLIHSEDYLHFLIGINNQEEEMQDILQFFNSFRQMDRIQGSWNTYVSPAGGYSVRFPGNPKENYMKNPQEEGSGTIISMISGSDNLTGNEYLVQFLDNPESYYSNDSSSMMVIQENILSTVPHSNVVSKDTLIQQFPAQVFGFDLENGQKLKVWLIIRGTRAYNLITAFLPGDKAELQAEEFLSSFRLTEFDYHNWSLRQSDTGAFQAMAPAGFRKQFHFSLDPKFELSERYFSFDSLTGDKVVVVKMIYSPYYRAVPDSSFFREYWKDNFEDGDSVLSMTQDSRNPLCWVLKSKNPGSHQIIHYQLVLHERGMYTLIAMAPEALYGSHPAITGLASFRVTDTLFPGTLSDAKLPMLLSDLRSESPEVRVSARKALAFYAFTREELETVWDAIQLTYGDDSAGYYGTKALLLDAMIMSADSAWKDRLRNSFEKAATDPYARIKALQVLMQDFHPEYAGFVREQFIRCIAGREDYSVLTGMLMDSLDYAMPFYPEILQDLQDSLNRTTLVLLTLVMLEEERIPAGMLTEYLPVIRQGMREMLKDATEFIPDYADARLFLLAGYTRDAEILQLLNKGQSSHNPMIAEFSLRSLIRNEEKFNRKSLENMLKNPAYRRTFYDFLNSQHKLDLIPSKYKTQSAIAESDLYLSLESEEYISIRIHLKGQQEWFINDSLQRFYLFQAEAEYYGDPESFYTIMGPYPASGAVPAESVPAADYRSSEERMSPAAHFSEFRKQLDERKE